MLNTVANWKGYKYFACWHNWAWIKILNVWTYTIDSRWFWLTKMYWHLNYSMCNVSPSYVKYQSRDLKCLPIMLSISYVTPNVCLLCRVSVTCPPNMYVMSLVALTTPNVCLLCWMTLNAKHKRMLSTVFFWPTESPEWK